MLHTGSSYDDDLTEDCILYHYPSTKRPSSRDQGEIDATKNAAKLGVPLFVITYPSPSSQYRDVKLAWVEDWDDESQIFLMTFGEEPVTREPFDDSASFQLTTAERPRRSTRATRSGQQEFKFRVLKRYGPTCAFCDIQVLETLDAAHLCPKAENGSDDPRNGLVLCATHHRAFDSGLAGVHPQQLTIETTENGPSRADLRITTKDLAGLRNKPHVEALEWCWRRFSPSK